MFHFNCIHCIQLHYKDWIDKNYLKYEILEHKKYKNYYLHIFDN